jgi:hypothetical protein
MRNCKTCDFFSLSKDEHPCLYCSGDLSKYKHETQERTCVTCKHATRVATGTKCRTCIEINKEYIAASGYTEYEKTNKLYGWYWEKI